MKTLATRDGGRAFLYYVAVAGLAVFSFGSGTIIGDGQAELHLDPIAFVRSLAYAWDPNQFLGRHTGFSHVYEMPYSWLYAALQALHVSSDISQRIVMFLLYFSIVAGMHYCLKGIDRGLPLLATIGGSTAYLLNVYVAFNSQGSIPMLLTYAALPVIVGIVARVADDRWSIGKGCLGVAITVLAAGGVNPPLLAINLVAIAAFAGVLILRSGDRRIVFSRLLRFGILAGIASLAVSLYWVVPFLDYIRTAWIGGILIEPASMHDPSTSFVNVFRGLGQWAIFQGFGGKPYYPWSGAYGAGFFAFALWIVPLAGFFALTLRRNMHWRTLYFLGLVVISLPLVVGYHHDALGASITTPLYDLLYRKVPGFQMFRSVYKWISTYEFGISGLFAYAIASIQIKTASLSNRPLLTRFAGALPFVLAAVPIISYLPVVVSKANYPTLPVPSWQRHEGALAGNDDAHRVAVFPTQYLESFLWGQTAYPVEDSFLHRPTIMGYLGDAPQAGSDNWIKAAYRLTRIGSPVARSIMRTLGVDTILQRDDATSPIDFSFSGLNIKNNTTLTHDLITRTLGAKPVTSNGPIRLYALSGALPIVYGVAHPTLSSDPAFEIPDVGDPERMGRGEAVISPHDWGDGESLDQIAKSAVLIPESRGALTDMAVQIAMKGAIVLRPQSVQASFSGSGVYDVFARAMPKLAGDFWRLRKLRVDIHSLNAPSGFGVFSDFGRVSLRKGIHTVEIRDCRGACEIALISPRKFDEAMVKATKLSKTPTLREPFSGHVFARVARIALPAGTYRLSATAAYPTLPVDTRLRAAVSHRVPNELAFAGSRFNSRNADLAFVPGDDITGASFATYPQRWFDTSGELYQLLRQGATWLIVHREGHFEVFLPGTRAARVIATAHISAQEPMRDGQASVAGGRGATPLEIGGGRRGVNDAFPVEARFTVTLVPGWNRVALHFDPVNPADAPHDQGIGVAFAPDLSFRVVARVGTPRPSLPRSPVSMKMAVFPIGGFPRTAVGDPSLEAYYTADPLVDAWIAVTYSATSRGPIAYRIYPVGNGALDLGLLSGLENSAEDSNQTITGVWFVVSSGMQAPLPTDAASILSGAHIKLHAIGSSPIGRVLLDGLDATNPVAVKAGIHTVRFAASGARLRNVLVQRAASPKSELVPLVWHRWTPVHLTVDLPRAHYPTLIVFGESYHPEWQAKCGDERLPHVVVDGYANGWLVPNSCHAPAIDVFFVAQRLYTISLLISAISLLALFGFAFARHHRNEGRAKL